jgi:hypothetical protein
MIVRITKHRTDPDLVLAHTPPDLAASVMGPYGPARYSKALRAYLLRAEHIEQFRGHLARHDVLLVDERKADDGAEKFTGPLPECSACGQPASRQAALSLNRCPACGAAWRPVVVDTPAATGSWTPKVDCEVCGRRQRAGWAYCGGCGAPAEPLGAPGPRPEHVVRPRLAEPALFGDVADEVLSGLAERQGELGEEHDEDRDYAQRAAGDR